MFKKVCNREKRSRNLEIVFIHAEHQERGYIVTEDIAEKSNIHIAENKMPATNIEKTESRISNVIDVLHLSNTNSSVSSTEKPIANKSNDMHKAMTAVDFVCSKKISDSNNDATAIEQKPFFKDEIKEFINECKTKTDSVSNSNDSLLALNSVLLSKIIDKVDDLDKKLSSVYFFCVHKCIFNLLIILYLVHNMCIFISNLNFYLTSCSYIFIMIIFIKLVVIP